MELYFSKANSKLLELQKAEGVRVYSFDLPAGHTCPAASLCKSYVDYLTGKIVDEGMFRCYAASAEVQYKNVRESRRRNFEYVKEHGMSASNVPMNAGIVRIHSSGDFFNERYFLSWLETARNLPEIVFYAYTKMAPFIIKHRASIPDNMSFAYSHGGVFDDMAESSHLPTCYVWTGGDLLAPLACETDKNDDYDLIREGKSFSLRVHGTQPSGFKKPGESPAKPGNV